MSPLKKCLTQNKHTQVSLDHSKAHFWKFLPTCIGAGLKVLAPRTAHCASEFRLNNLLIPKLKYHLV